MPQPERIFPMVLALVIGVLGVLPASAALVSADLENGSQIFSTNCAGCHMGGGNVIRASRTLSQSDLQAHLDSYSQDHLEAIEHQIELGKNAMPPYEGKLSEADIADVAAYVEEQAERGWQR
ncbi:MAG: c-type cytochrome [Synechococcus sp.]